MLKGLDAAGAKRHAVNVTCRRVTNDEELGTALAIREEVFIDEQGVPPDEERDACDATAIHVLAFLGDDAVGTARLVQTSPGHGKIGRVAVRAVARGAKVGAALMEALTEIARSDGLRELYLDAQIQVIGFYARLGYVEEGGLFEDAGIMHRRMRRRL